MNQPLSYGNALIYEECEANYNVATEQSVLITWDCNVDQQSSIFSIVPHSLVREVTVKPIEGVIEYYNIHTTISVSLVSIINHSMLLQQTRSLPLLHMYQQPLAVL